MMFSASELATIMGLVGIRSEVDAIISRALDRQTWSAVTKRCANPMFTMQKWYAFEHVDSCLHYDHVDGFWQR